MSTQWKYDETLLSEMQESIQQALHTLRSQQNQLDDTSEALLQLLDATGVIYFMGAEDTLSWRTKLASKEPDFLQRLQDKTRHFFLSADGHELEEAGNFLMDNAPKLAAGDELPSLAEEMLDALSVRHHLELCLEGARYLLNQEQLPEVGEELLLSWSSFDGGLETILWQLTPLNPQRQQRLGWVAPQHRTRLWWWSHGADLPANSIDAMITTARVLTAFPEAEGALQDMLFRERQLQEALHSGNTSDASETATAEQHTIEVAGGAFPVTIPDLGEGFVELPQATLTTQVFEAKAPKRYISTPDFELSLEDSKLFLYPNEALEAQEIELWFNGKLQGRGKIANKIELKLDAKEHNISLEALAHLLELRRIK